MQSIKSVFLYGLKGIEKVDAKSVGWSTPFAFTIEEAREKRFAVLTARNEKRTHLRTRIMKWRGKWMCTHGNFYELASTPAEAYRKLQLSLHTHTGTKP